MNEDYGSGIDHGTANVRLVTPKLTDRSNEASHRIESFLKKKTKSRVGESLILSEAASKKPIRVGRRNEQCPW